MEIINPSKYKDLNIKNFKNLEEIQDVSFITRFLVFVALFLAIFLDLLSVILGAIDLGTIGIIGWLLRSIFIFIKAVFFALFWYLSNVYNYEGGLESFHQNVLRLKRYSKYLIYTLRTLIGFSALSSLIPIIGTIIDVLPIETLSVILAFFVWPYLSKIILKEKGNMNIEIKSFLSLEIFKNRLLKQKNE